MAKKIARLEVDLAANTAKFMESMNRAAKSVKKTSDKIKSSLGQAQLAIGGFFTSQGVGELVRFATTYESVERTFAAVAHSSKEAGEQMRFATSLAKRFKLEIESTIVGFSGFFAASRNTSLTLKEMQSVFSSVVKTTAVLGTTADETKGIFKALEQILSKGKVSAEELRGQLGERLKGSFDIAARAIGVTKSELDKLLQLGALQSDRFILAFGEELEKTYGSKVQSALDGTQAKVNEFKNSIFQLQKQMTSSGFVNAITMMGGFITNQLIKPLISGIQFLGEFKAFQSQKSISANKKELARFEEEVRKLEGRKERIGSGVRTVRGWVRWTEKEQLALKFSKRRVKELKEEIELEKKSAQVKNKVSQETSKKTEEYRKEIRQILDGNKVKKEQTKIEKDLLKFEKDREKMAERIRSQLQTREEANESLRNKIRELGEEVEKNGKKFKAVFSEDEVQKLLLRTQDEVKNTTKVVSTELSKMDRLIVNWGDRLTDTLTNAFMTGKLSFKDMINSMISDFARMTIKQSITTPLLQSLVPNFFSQGKIGAGSAGPNFADMPTTLGGTKDFLRPMAPASQASIKPSIQVIDQRSQSAPDLRIEKVNTNGGQAVRMTIMDTVKDGLLNGNFSRELAFATNRRGS